MKVFSSVIARLLRSKAEHRVPESRSLASRAWISTGSLTDHNYFTKVDRLEIVMRKIYAESPLPPDRLRILLQSVSRLFKEQFKYGAVTTGESLHCLSIKLGIESCIHRTLKKLYGRISTGSLTGHNYFTKVDTLDMVMQEISAESPIPIDRLWLLLLSVSRLFEEQFEYGDKTTGESVHCLSIKIGIESYINRSINKLYGRISTGSLSGHNYFTKVDALDMVMRKISAESPIPLDRLRLLLQSVSRLFEERFEYEVTTGQNLHCLTIKLGIESHIHRDLITMYGRQLAIHRESVRKVMQIIPRGSFYKSLDSMVHSFGYMCPNDSLAAFGIIVKLGFPSVSSISGLLVTLRYQNLGLNDAWRVEWGAQSIVLFMKHHRMPFEPKIVGGLTEMFVANGLISNALEMLLETPRIDDITITSFLSGCTKHEDMASASKLVRHLEKKGTIYTLNEALVRKLIFKGIGVTFGENVIIETKEVGLSLLISKPNGGMI